MESPRDNNHVPALMGISCDDGVTAIPISIDAVGNVRIDEVSTISVVAYEAQRDENHVPTWMAVSSVDGVTPVPIYVNSEGKVLIDR